MDIRRLYEEIQQKYSLMDDVQELFLYETYLSVCRDYLLSKPNGRVAIYGAGRNTTELMSSAIWEELRNHIEVIIDNHFEEGSIQGIPVITEEELAEYDIKIAMISSWIFRDEMSKNICRKFPDIEVFDPYEIVLAKMPQINSAFFTYKGVEKNQWFARRRKLLECADQITIRQRVLKELIHGYFAIYDWVDLREFISIYTQEDHADSEKYECLGKDIEIFLQVIKEEIEKRTQGDCLIFLVDSLSKYVAADMPHLAEWGKSGTTFANLVNEYPSTRDVHVSLFTGWHPLRDKTSTGRVIEYCDSDLLKMLESRQVEIKKLALDGFCEENFRKINCYLPEGLRDRRLLTEITFWGIEELLKSEQQQIIIMDSDETIHPYHWNPRSSKLTWKNNTSWEEHKKRFKESVSFTDDIIDFYLELLDGNKEMTKIVMGDHGINLETEYAHDIASKTIKGKIGLWDMETLSPTLMIWNKSWQPETITQMVSMNSFHKILYAAVRNQDVHTVLENKEFLDLEFVPGYNENWIRRAIYSDNYYLALGAKGLISSEYIFLRFEDDTDRLFRICGKKIEECNNELPAFISKIGQEKYEECRFPKAILEDKFFEAHNKYYQGNYREEYKRCVIKNVDLEITERCSLKCKNCFNCMQYYEKPQDIPTDKIKKSVDILSEYVDEIGEMRILGGEPFMNKDLREITEYVCSKENVKNVKIYTNATIIPSKEELELFSAKNVSFYITDYGLEDRQKVNQIENLFKEYGITYKTYRLEFWYNPGNIYDNHKSKEELESTYKFCWGRDCITLLEGKLFQCEIAANANRLEMIPDFNQDYVDLFETANLRKRLMEFLYEKKYTESCKWCNLTTEQVKPGEQISHRIE